MQWETVIGLEVHVQLATQSKIFSGSATTYGALPNTQASAIDLAMPGVLPVLNQEALTLAVRFGTSINASIAQHSVFARKNYFYPDLPKGYQISQYEQPIVGQGHLDIEVDNQSKRIGITRAHLEEDAGKSLHEGLPGSSGIDLNRAGTPLLEIVSEPDLRSAKEAVSYLKTLHQLVRYLKISDGNMQEGSFRCDVNVSLRPLGSETLGTRTEVKNVNSFRFVERAILYEIQRQQDILESGGTVTQQTCLYDPNKDETRPMRNKEEAYDYRYFPDPDLLPVTISTDFINQIRNNLPELPWDKRQRFQTDYGLNQYDANVIVSEQATADFFEHTCAELDKAQAKLVANWVTGDLAAQLNKQNLNIDESPVNPKQLALLLKRISDNTISNSIAKTVFTAMWDGEGSADDIIDKRGLKQITDQSALAKIVSEVIANNPKQVEQYRAGKDKLIAYFVGQVMKATKGKANPAQVNELLLNQLK